MAVMISLDQALDRLLHSRSYRQAFLEDRNAALELTNEDLLALTTVDREQLVRAANRVREDLLHRTHRGSGGLTAMYPRTIAAWRELEPDDAALEKLLDLLMESEEFGDYRELPFAGLAVSL